MKIKKEWVTTISKDKARNAFKMMYALKQVNPKFCDPNQKSFIQSMRNEIRRSELHISFINKNREILNYKSDKYSFKSLVSLRSQAINMVKEERFKKHILNEKAIQNTSKRINGKLHSIKRIAGCHSKPNTFLDIQESNFLGRFFNVKYPKLTDKKYVGIELEFFSDSDDDELAKLLFNKDKQLAKMVEIKSDGSITGYDDQHPHELAILCEEDKIEDTIKSICEVLKEDNANVNTSCGMHVHLDMRNRNKEIAFSNLVSAQSVLYAMNPKSRSKGDGYSTRTRGKDLSKFNEDSDRYKGINPTALYKHKTIECRIHSGTILYEKIINWCHLLIKIVDSSKEMKRATKDIEKFGAFFNLNTKLIEYINIRMAKFNHKDSLEDTDDDSYEGLPSQDSIQEMVF